LTLGIRKLKPEWRNY